MRAGKTLCRVRLILIKAKKLKKTGVRAATVPATTSTTVQSFVRGSVNGIINVLTAPGGPTILRGCGGRALTSVPL